MYHAENSVTRVVHHLSVPIGLEEPRANLVDLCEAFWVGDRNL
jgi:hypothetical protein